MLELCARMPFGKQVGYLLHLQRAFESNRACDVVANSQGAKTFAPALTQGAERVRSFTALAYGKDQRLRRHGCVAMPKLTGVIDFRGNVRQSLDQIFADSCGVQRSATAGKNDSADVAQLCRRHVQAAQL